MKELIGRKGECIEFSFRRMEIEILDYPLEMVFRVLKISTGSKEYIFRIECYLHRVDN